MGISIHPLSNYNRGIETKQSLFGIWILDSEMEIADDGCLTATVSMRNRHTHTM